MAKKKSSKKKSSKKQKPEKNAFLGSLERLGGKKLEQPGAEAAQGGRESHKHLVGGGRRNNG